MVPFQFNIRRLIFLTFNKAIYIYIYRVIEKKSTFSFFIKQIRITFYSDQLESKFKLLREAKSTLVIMKKSQLLGSSLLEQKMDPIRDKNTKFCFFEKCRYLTGPLSQGLQIFRIRRSYSQKNSPQTTENQKDMLWITVGFNRPIKSFYVNF